MEKILVASAILRAKVEQFNDALYTAGEDLSAIRTSDVKSALMDLERAIENHRSGFPEGRIL